jgi:hypothetical protein
MDSWTDGIKLVVPIILDSLLSFLKPCQLESIKHTQAPQLILAGAGTGKTTTITARIAVVLITSSLHALKKFHSHNSFVRKLFFEARPVSTVFAAPYT